MNFLILIWMVLALSSLSNSRTIRQTSSTPSRSSGQGSENTTQLTGSSHLNGFTYEVRFPPRKQESIDVSISRPNLPPSVNSFRSDLAVMESHDQTSRINELEPNSESSLLHKVSNQQVAPRKMTERESSSSGLEGYHYERPSNESDLPEEEKKIHGCLQSNQIAFSRDSSVVSSPREDEKNLQGKNFEEKSAQESQVVLDVLQPETYSSVQITGSVFTPEGLPALGSDEEFPVNYRFSYAIHGQPSLGHEESRDGDQSAGVYWVNLPDGRVQEVRYTVDGEQGYQPRVTYSRAANTQ